MDVRAIGFGEDLVVKMFVKLYAAAAKWIARL